MSAMPESDRLEFERVCKVARQLFVKVVCPWARDIGFDGTYTRRTSRGRYWLMVNIGGDTIDADLFVSPCLHIVATLTMGGEGGSARINPSVPLEELEEVLTNWLEDVAEPMILPEEAGEMHEQARARWGEQN